MKHLIKTQIVEVSVHGSKEDFQLNQKLSEFFYQSILPSLEKIFDEISPENQLLQLDRVEIDLGRIDINDVSSTSLNHFEETMIRQLQAMVSAPGNRKPRPVFYSVTEQWLYYMQHGFLPWNAEEPNEAWQLKVLEGLATDIASIEALRKLLVSNEQALRRIVFRHDQEFRLHILEVLVAAKQERLPSMIQDLSDFLISKDPGSRSINSVDMQRKIWMSVLRSAAENMQLKTTNELIGNYLVRNLSTAQAIRLKANSQFPKELIPYLDPGPDQNKKPGPENKDKTTKDENRKESFPDDGVFLNHAGLVLLHPFLKIFFSRLDLIDGKKFRSETAQQKSVLLLHFLSTGKWNFEEHDLVIPKLLAGYPIEYTIDPAIELTDEQLAECDLLLNEMVAQWTVLKNTSPEGLRVNFLQRMGKLVQQNNEWKLIVESNVIDILLDRLPWSVSVIRLTWMPATLKVEWK